MELLDTMKSIVQDPKGKASNRLMCFLIIIDLTVCLQQTIT